MRILRSDDSEFIEDAKFEKIALPNALTRGSSASRAASASKVNARHQSNMNLSNTGQRAAMRQAQARGRSAVRASPAA